MEASNDFTKFLKKIGKNIPKKLYIEACIWLKTQFFFIIFPGFPGPPFPGGNFLVPYFLFPGFPPGNVHL